MYEAKSYIGRDYVPGEVLPDDTPEELIERWLAAGAIRKVEGAVAYAAAETRSADAAEDNPGGDGGDEEVEPEDEIDEEVEPEEIDVTAGLVAEPAPEKPKRKSGGKKS